MGSRTDVIYMKSKISFWSILPPRVNTGMLVTRGRYGSTRSFDGTSDLISPNLAGTSDIHHEAGALVMAFYLLLSSLPTPAPS